VAAQRVAGRPRRYLDLSIGESAAKGSSDDAQAMSFDGPGAGRATATRGEVGRVDERSLRMERRFQAPLLVAALVVIRRRSSRNPRPERSRRSARSSTTRSGWRS
jgi:hypothetical protein